MLQVFLQQSEIASHAGSLRRVFCSGEALSPHLVERFFACLPPEQVQLSNLYGPPRPPSM